MGFTRNIEDFTCEHCGATVKGNGYTNHCPMCLWSKHVDVDQGELTDPDLKLAEPVEGYVDFENAGDLLNITGRVKTVLEIPCARCLADVRVPLAVDIDERFPLAEVVQPPAASEDDAGLETLVSSVVHLDAGRPIGSLVVGLGLSQLAQ